MAGMFLIRDDANAATDAAIDTARAEYARGGFGDPAALALPGWRLLHWPYICGGPEMLLRDGDDLVAAAGTLSFDGKTGRDALAAILADLDPLAPDWTRLAGQFVLLIRKRGRSFLLTDYFGAYQLFRDTGDRIFSTSLLAAAQALPGVQFDPQGVYEFAFNVMPIGDDTVFANLKTLGPDHVLELTSDGIVRHALAKPLPEPDHRKVDARIAAARALLDKAVAPWIAAFGDRIFCPLSGGLDSRLLLAAIRAQGASPDVYVYGPAGSEDVAIAQAIGAAEGFPVEWVEKGALRTLEPEQFAAQVARNFHEFDALPTYGNIFDNGGNAIARDKRHAGGALAASGGCGEVYRNFFYLPDRPVTAAAVASSFFARFTPDDTTAMFDRRDFLASIRDKLLEALGRPGDLRPIARGEIETLYPRVRCRALFGREISLEARQGAYLMPFLDQRVVADAMTLPIGLKNAGRFEARLIAALDPALAKYPSAYGHDFSGAPGKRHRFREWTTRIRPAWLRERSYALHRRRGRMQDEHGGLLGEAYLGQVIDTDFPAMRRWFRIDAINDDGLLRRVACLEYLAGYLGSRLVR